MKNTSFYKLLLACVVSILCLNISSVKAQRYRDRGQQNQNAEERKVEDNPDSLANKSFVERLVYGANFNLAIGNPTFIDVSPILGYRITPKFQAGIGATFIYYYDQEVYQYTNNPQNTYAVTNQGVMYGGRIYAEYDLFSTIFRPNDRFFVHAESEILNVPYFYQDPVSGLYTVVRASINDDYIGVGYREPFGRKGYFNLTLLYNANYTAYQYINPFGPVTIRLGFTF